MQLRINQINKNTESRSKFRDPSPQAGINQNSLIVPEIEAIRNQHKEITKSISNGLGEPYFEILQNFDLEPIY